MPYNMRYKHEGLYRAFENTMMDSGEIIPLTQDCMIELVVDHEERHGKLDPVDIYLTWYEAADYTVDAHIQNVFDTPQGDAQWRLDEDGITYEQWTERETASWEARRPRNVRRAELVALFKKACPICGQ